MRNSANIKEVEGVIFVEGGAGDVSVGGAHVTELDRDTGMNIDEGDRLPVPSKGKGKGRAQSSKRPLPSKKRKSEWIRCYSVSHYEVASDAPVIEGQDEDEDTIVS